MELPRRNRDDVYLPDGTFRAALRRLRPLADAQDLRIGLVYAFDFRTRMLPYWYADKRMSPCSVRTLADVLDAAGFKRIRVIVQQWTPNFRPRLAELDGKPLDLLLVSAMQVHAEPAYALIRDAHRLGEARPLIVAGGPKATYEPTDYFELGPDPGVGADCVVTGEAYVLLDLLKTLLQARRAEEPLRTTFARARCDDTLHSIPGLVYLSPQSTPARPVAVNTGVQRLLRDLDELPMPDAGFRLLEPPHGGARLKPRPLPADRVRRHTPIVSVISTHGCKFNCEYCSIPSANQRTWRHKSPARFADELQHLYETFGLDAFFGTDDNFFNNRDTVVALMEEMTRRKTGGEPLGSRVRFFTEATEFDVHRNQDILPLCHEGGLRAIWFGLEDITAELVNKGQTVGKTEQLFAYLRRLGIQPMAMVIHSDRQPLRSRKGDLSGLINQARYLFKKGAVSYQCTYLGPSVGTRSFEPAMQSGTIFRSVGTQPIPQAYYDGNHVVASEHPRPWRRQLNLLRAYATFYNPINLVKTFLGYRGDSISYKRLQFQVIGHIGLVMTIPRLARWVWRLRRGPIQVYGSLPDMRIPMIEPRTGSPMNWTFSHPLAKPHEASESTTVANHRSNMERGAAGTPLPVLQPS
jgi:radical SAM superfamily enzyme YgiQ (UPF0313 family)